MKYIGSYTGSGPGSRQMAYTWQHAMFYPNTYLNFNANGEYTKHYYNGNERIASRLGENTIDITLNNTNSVQLCNTIAEEYFRADVQALLCEEVPVDMPPVLDILNLQPTETPNNIFYYHVNHLGSTSFVTDQNQTLTQGFLYAPHGEIGTEYNAGFGNNLLPKRAFNGKELDEETGMYYYEARYYAPPVFISRDPLMNEKPWLTPYHYCSNNPTGRVDPTGMFDNEAEANKFHQQAVKKYGSERVGDIRQSAESGEYYFNVYGKDEVSFNEDGGMKEGVMTLNSVNVKAGSARAVFSKKGYKSMLKSDMRSGGVSPSKSFKAEQSIRQFEDKFVDASQVFWSGAVLFNPLIGIPNDVMTLFIGEDMYGNQATAGDRVWAATSLVTFGIGNIPRSSRYSVNLLRDIGNVGNFTTTSKSTIETMLAEYEKTKNK